MNNNETNIAETEQSMSQIVLEMLIAAGVDTTEIDTYGPKIIEENSKYNTIARDFGRESSSK